MEAVWTSAVAVAGTLLGSVLTYAFQRLAAGREALFARAEELRKERVATYSGYAAAVEEYRRGQVTRWYLKAEEPDGEAYRRVRDEAHRLRTAARQALYRVKLLTDEPEVVAAAEHAYRSTWDVSNATDREGHDARDESARRAIEAFVSRAAPLVR